ncbi:HIT family protein [Paenibacillus periandrae]|uniref:HIT family protein n=1 Tax=Paenibacillus periandrae TaxID=1761741 RepID=UPI001F08F704|nr:HIT domain-containing protein [Paenibacillus periandrae]
MSNCKICLKEQSSDPYFVMEKGHYVVYHAPVEKQLVGYLYVEPKRHVESWHHLTLDEKNELPEIIAQLEEMLYRELQAERVYTLTVGEVVRHLHIHLIPRCAGAAIDGLELIQRAAGPAGTGQSVCEGEIRQFIESIQALNGK